MMNTALFLLSPKYRTIVHHEIRQLNGAQTLQHMSNVTYQIKVEPVDLNLEVIYFLLCEVLGM